MKMKFHEQRNRLSGLLIVTCWRLLIQQGAAMDLKKIHYSTLNYLDNKHLYNHPSYVRPGTYNLIGEFAVLFVYLIDNDCMLNVINMLAMLYLCEYLMICCWKSFVRETDFSMMSSIWNNNYPYIIYLKIIQRTAFYRARNRRHL